MFTNLCGWYAPKKQQLNKICIEDSILISLMLTKPIFKFQEIEKSQKLAEEMLQMPPVVPVRKEIDAVISRDPELTGWDKAKYVFTDITFGKTDRVSYHLYQLNIVC